MSEAKLKAVYFAWVRERVGKAEEILEPPEGVQTVADLVGWLSQRDEGYAHAFENPNVVRAPASLASGFTCTRSSAARTTFGFSNACA